ncbi:MAG: TolC family outer membrane protein [Magnetococcus sp. YQC-3]
MANITKKLTTSRRDVLALAVMFAVAFQADPAWSLTIKEAADLAVKTYPDVQAAEEFGKALDQKVRQAFAGYLPKMDFSTGYGPETADNATTRAVNKAISRDQHGLTMNRGEATLILKQNIFDGYDVRAKVAQAKAQLQSAQSRLESTADSVALMAVQVYVDLVLKHIQLELIKDNVLLHQRIMAKVQKKFEGGAGTEADVNQAKSRTFLASANHASNQAAYKNAQAKFTEIVGLPPLLEQEMLRPIAPEKLLPKSVEEALDAALRNSDELEAARFNLVAAEAGLEIAKATLYPKVDMELTGANNANVGGSAGHGQTLTAMVRMNYNVFDGGADVSKIQEQRNMLEQARQVLDKTQRALEETTREAWNKVAMAQNRISFMRQHYAVSKQVTASYHDQFKMGKRTLLDVLNSENELFAAKNGLLFEELTYAKSTYELFAKMGILRDALQSLPPPTPEQRIQIERDEEKPGTDRLEPDVKPEGENADAKPEGKEAGQGKGEPGASGAAPDKPKEQGGESKPAAALPSKGKGVVGKTEGVKKQLKVEQMKGLDRGDAESRQERALLQPLQEEPPLPIQELAPLPARQLVANPESSGGDAQPVARQEGASQEVATAAHGNPAVGPLAQKPDNDGMGQGDKAESSGSFFSHLRFWEGSGAERAERSRDKEEGVAASRGDEGNSYFSFLKLWEKPAVKESERSLSEPLPAVQDVGSGASGDAGGVSQVGREEGVSGVVQVSANYYNPLHIHAVREEELLPANDKVVPDNASPE